MRIADPYRLVVLRHGQSEWNAAGLFTGWENAHLTTEGELEAAHAVKNQGREAPPGASGGTGGASGGTGQV